MTEKTADAAKPLSKTAVYQELAAKTNLERKDVATVIEALEELIKDQLGKKGPGVFALGDIVKIKLDKKPARKAGKKPNPFKPGEMMDVKAQAASTKVKVTKLKGLKEFES